MKQPRIRSVMVVIAPWPLRTKNWGNLTHAAHIGAAPALRPASMWQFLHASPLPTNGWALTPVLLKMSIARLIASPSGPLGMAEAGGGAKAAGGPLGPGPVGPPA